MENFIYKNKSEITALSARMEKFSYKKHSHEEYSIGVTLHGIQEYHLDGSLQSSHKSGVMLFNPEQTHDGKAHDIKDGLNYVMLYIKPELFLEALGKKEIVKFSSPIVYNQKLAQDILNLSSAILNQNADALCNELLISLVDNFTSENLYSNFKHDSHFIAKAKEMIYYEIDNVLKLDDICKEVNMTKFQFIRAFKESTGLPPYQYFINSKVIHAKKYLEKTRDIYATIVEFGFVDLSHLNKHFKKIYGVTAYEYLSHLD